MRAFCMLLLLVSIGVAVGDVLLAGPASNDDKKQVTDTQLAPSHIGPSDSLGSDLKEAWWSPRRQPSSPRRQPPSPRRPAPAPWQPARPRAGSPVVQPLSPRAPSNLLNWRAPLPAINIRRVPLQPLNPPGQGGPGRPPLGPLPGVNPQRVSLPPANPQRLGFIQPPRERPRGGVQPRPYPPNDRPSHTF